VTLDDDIDDGQIVRGEDKFDPGMFDVATNEDTDGFWLVLLEVSDGCILCWWSC
jgi:hypothetical protein